MADHQVTYEVEQGTYGICSIDESIGTSGCGTCIGIIAVSGNKVFCGHMDNREPIKLKGLEDRLKPFIQRGDEVTLVAGWGPSKVQSVLIPALKALCGANISYRDPGNGLYREAGVGDGKDKVHEFPITDGVVGKKLKTGDFHYEK